MKETVEKLVNALWRLNVSHDLADSILNECLATLEGNDLPFPDAWQSYESEKIFNFKKYLVNEYSAYQFAYTGKEWLILNNPL